MTEPLDARSALGVVGAAEVDPDLSLTLPADLSAARAAREVVAAHAVFLPPELVSDATLLVSELVTNAIRHGRPAFTLHLMTMPRAVRVGVHDCGRRLPSRTPRPVVSSQAIDGRGLMLVDALASSWGIVRTSKPVGKACGSNCAHRPRHDGWLAVLPPLITGHAVVGEIRRSRGRPRGWRPDPCWCPFPGSATPRQQALCRPWHQLRTRTSR